MDRGEVGCCSDYRVNPAPKLHVMIRRSQRELTSFNLDYKVKYRSHRPTCERYNFHVSLCTAQYTQLKPTMASKEKKKTAIVVGKLPLHQSGPNLTAFRCRSRRRRLCSTTCQSRILGHRSRKELLHRRALQLNQPRRVSFRPRPLTPPPPKAVQRNLPRPRHLARSRRRPTAQMRTEL
jgi:hypothetical protein